MAKLTLTAQQQAVVENRGGSLLVSAAAGSGKTKVLVDRLFRYVTEERCNIDDFLTMDGKFIAIKHWKPSETQSIGETGVFRFEAGAHPDLFEHFMANMDEVKANNRHEQAYVISTLHKRGELSFWPEKWMPSFKYNCMRPFPLCFFQEPVLPEGAKMIVFHGNPTPDQAMRGEIKGIKKLFRHVITPKWLKENWR